MKNLNEKELLKRLHAPRKCSRISYKEIENPDYEVWGRARYWSYQQAVCLLAGLAPIAKPYFDLLTSDRPAIHLVEHFEYYPIQSTDRNRLKNIDQLLGDIPLAAQSKNTNTALCPKDLLAICKIHPLLAPHLPSRLLGIVDAYGAHPSLDLPNDFSALEINPCALASFKKMQERKKLPRALGTVVKGDLVKSLPVPPPPSEPPLAIAKRLFPLINVSKWEKSDVLSVSETILLYYKIDPDRFYQPYVDREPIDPALREFFDYLNSFFLGDRDRFISQLDESKIEDLLLRAINAKFLKIIHGGTLLTGSVVDWIRSKNLPFPIERQKKLEEPQSILQDNLKQIMLAYDMGHLRPEQQGKLLCRIVATSLWKGDKNLSLPKILKHPLLKEAVSLSQKIMKKTDQIEPKTVEDWIRDINPNYNRKKTQKWHSS